MKDDTTTTDVQHAAETYGQMKERHQQEYNRANLCKYAFGRDQFNAMLKEWGLTDTPDDLKKIVHHGAGAYSLKADAVKLDDLFSRQWSELVERMESDDAFFISALQYEMANHEFSLTRDWDETTRGLPVDWKNERHCRLAEQAEKEYLKSNE